MRLTRSVTVPAGARWPDVEGGFPWSSRFGWVLVENRGLAAVVVSTGKAPLNDPLDYDRLIEAGRRGC
jgi:hypothetical protein